MSLSDNGIVYTGRFRGHESVFETNLRCLGVRTLNSAPFHPQTCGKIERFWQTLKKWLNARDPADTIEDLNNLREEFRGFYNHHRPHRALTGATPPETFHATAAARPIDRPLPAPVFVSHHTVDRKTGRLPRRGGCPGHGHRRLELLADGLAFPWKVSAGTTAIDRTV